MLLEKCFSNHHINLISCLIIRTGDGNNNNNDDNKKGSNYHSWFWLCDELFMKSELTRRRMTGSACPLRRDWYKDRRHCWTHCLLLLGGYNWTSQVLYTLTNIVIYTYTITILCICIYLFEKFSHTIIYNAIITLSCIFDFRKILKIPFIYKYNFYPFALKQ